jgi:fucose 4-O-acetylase-like acetyltransferase
MATRLAISFWVGGAILFVITSVAEQRHPQFDSLIRDQLATIRFPLYYIFGWVCLGTTLIASVIAAMLNKDCLRKRLLACCCLALISTAIAVVDYKWVYQPLQVLITPPGQARTQQFVTLHDQSRVINEVHLTIALIAAIVICLPEKSQGECKA